MKLFTGFIIVIILSFCAASCAKEDVKFQKMPDNGNVQLNCPDSGKGN